MKVRKDRTKCCLGRRRNGFRPQPANGIAILSTGILDCTIPPYWNRIHSTAYLSNTSDCHPFRLALNLAHLACCAAAIFALLLADIFRRLRIGLPPYTPAKALSAGSIPDNCFATRSISFFNCFIIEDRFGIVRLVRGL